MNEMKSYEFTPQRVCARKITFDLDEEKKSII